MTEKEREGREGEGRREGRKGLGSRINEEEREGEQRK